MDKKEPMIVRKSNDLVSNFASDIENTMEMDLFDFMIANINSPQYDQDFHLIEFNIRDFYKTSYGKDPGGEDYRLLKKAIGDLANRQHWGIVKEGKYKNHETIMRLIDKPYINPETGRIILKLDDNLKPYLLDFANKPHTRFLYLTKASLSTGYSKRLYEILKSKENLAFGIWPSGDNYLTVDEFKTLMGIPESYKHANIIKRILEPCLKEIENKTDISFSYRLIKKGKGVLGYQFRIFKQEDKLDKAPPVPKRKLVTKDAEYFKELKNAVESENIDGLDAYINEYLMLFYGKIDDMNKTVYIKSLIAKIKRAKEIKTTKLVYAEGIVRKEIENTKELKSVHKEYERKLPDWYGNEDDEFKPASEEDLKEFEKILDELK